MARRARAMGGTPANTPKRTPGTTTEEYPLWLHKPTGYWCKKIGGRRIYFGRDREAALAKYKARLEGEPISDETVTAEELIHRCLGAKRERVEAGRLTEGTWADYRYVLKVVEATWGKATPVESLGPKDFARLGTAFVRRGHGVARQQKNYVVVNMLFRWGVKNELIDRIPAYGDFAPPTAKELRAARRSRMMQAAEIRAMLDKASPTMRVCILLALNAGLGNTDCSLLTTDKIEGEWLSYPRRKTAMPRRAWLWPMTRDAIAELGAALGKPKGRLIPHSANEISRLCGELLAKCGFKRGGVRFYALRHVFQTIAKEVRDLEALRAVMGHAPDGRDMGARYDERPLASPELTGEPRRQADERIRAVCEHVMYWLILDRCSGPGVP